MITTLLPSTFYVSPGVFRAILLLWHHELCWRQIWIACSILLFFCISHSKPVRFSMLLLRSTPLRRLDLTVSVNLAGNFISQSLRGSKMSRSALSCSWDVLLSLNRRWIYHLRKCSKRILYFSCMKFLSPSFDNNLTLCQIIIFMLFNLTLIVLFLDQQILLRKRGIARRSWHNFRIGL